MEENKKILFITKNFPPIIDGVGDYTYHLSIEFSKQYKVDIITHNPVAKENELINELKMYNIDVHYLNFESKSKQNDLISLVEQISPNWLNLQYVGYSFHPYGFPFWLVNPLKHFKKNGIKVLLTVHETYIRRNTFKNTLISLLQQKSLTKIAKYSNVLITSIERYAQQLKKNHSNVHVIPIGSNIKPIKFSEDEISFWKEQHEFSNKKNILCFGNRNHLFALSVLKELIQKDESFCLIITGKQSHTIEHRKYIEAEHLQNHVVTTGILENNELAKYLTAADLLLLKEKLDLKGRGGVSGKSGVVAAAITFGLPIFANRGDMTDNFFKHNKNIFFISDNASQVAQDILTSYKTGDLEILKIEVQKFKHFNSWHTIVKKAERILKSCYYSSNA